MTTTAAFIVAQVAEAAEIAKALPGGPAALILAYGPLGVSCWWLSREHGRLRREKAAAEIAQRAELKARDDLLREITEKHTTALGKATHQISGLSRALVYNAATHGPEAIRAIAQREIDRWDSRPAGTD